MTEMDTQDREILLQVYETATRTEEAVSSIQRELEQVKTATDETKRSQDERIDSLENRVGRNDTVLRGVVLVSTAAMTAVFSKLAGWLHF